MQKKSEKRERDILQKVFSVDLKERSKSVMEFGKRAMKRLKKDFDLVICISGYNGIGKSTLALRLANSLNPDAFGWEDVMFTSDAETIKNAILHNPRYSAVIIDEAIKSFYKKLHYKQEQIGLAQLFNICRKENKCLILVIPRLTDLGESFRNFRVWLHVWCYDRGKAALFKRDASTFNESDAWHMKYNREIEKEAIKRGKKIEEVVHKMQGFIGDIYWEDIEPEVKKEYRRRSIEAEAKDLAIGDKSEGVLSDRWRSRFKNISEYLLLKGILKRRKLSAISKCPDTTLAEVLGKEVCEKIHNNNNKRRISLHLNNNNICKSPSFETDKLTKQVKE